MMIVNRKAQLTGHNGAVFAICRGATPNIIYSGAGDGWLVAWDLAQPDLGRLVAKTDRTVYSLCFLADKNCLVAGDMDGGVRFVHLDNPDLNRNIKHHSKGVFSIQVFNNQLLSIGGDGILTRWQPDTMRSEQSLQLSAKSLRAIDYSAAKNEIAIGASDGSIYFLDATTWDVKRTWQTAHPPSVFSLKFAQNDWFLTGGRDAHLRLWQGNTEATAIPAHLFTVNDIVFHPTDNTLFATASRDKTIKIWKITEGGDSDEKTTLRLLKVIDLFKSDGHLRSVNRLFWSSYNNYLVSASDDRSLMVWEING
jgi:WD40 repeat protein